MSQYPNDLPPFPFPVGTMVSGHYHGMTFAGRVLECPGPNLVIVLGRRIPVQSVTSFELPVAPAAGEAYDLDFDLPDEEVVEVATFDFED